MLDVCVTVHIAAPTDVVFHQAARVAQWPDFISAVMKVELLTDGEVGRGTRFRETRVMFGQEATEEMEFTEFDPPNSFVTEAESCGTHYFTRHYFRPTKDGGTDVVLEFEGKPLTFWSKVMGKLLAPLMTRMLAKTIRADLEDIKQSVEVDRGDNTVSADR